MPAQLVALTEGPNILLDKPIMLFGRHPECDIQIESRKVSRRHCCVAQVSDYLVVRDLGSTNGIRINGNRVLEGRLQGGDELTIGSHRYRVRWDAVPLPALPAPPRAVPVAPVAPPQVGTGPLEDQMLEECDEPVPLADPKSPVVPTKAPPAHELPSSIFPDNLELAPSSSDVKPGGLPPRAD
jgi:predicted component of type VI protein secretion system